MQMPMAWCGGMAAARTVPCHTTPHYTIAPRQTATLRDVCVACEAAVELVAGETHGALLSDVGECFTWGEASPHPSPGAPSQSGSLSDL